jgi:AAA15 family ATPase/GTPase
MLKSLKIENYRCIKRLEIPELADVNLITGKNNTGKTSVLEAISLLASRLDTNWLMEILKSRGELLRNAEQRLAYDAIKSIGSFFYNGEISFDDLNIVYIGNTEDNLAIQFVRYIEENIEQTNPITKEVALLGRKLKKVASNEFPDSQIGVETQIGNIQQIRPIDRVLPANRSGRFPHYEEFKKMTNFRFVRPSFSENEENGFLWDKIALSEKEDALIEALQLIDNGIEKIAFVKDSSMLADRWVTVKLKGRSERVSLKSMGDGINRVLSIALNLVNADNGYLLIDEFENGLHYSVQEQLWRFIFEVSKRLNVQVFATTHSSDCIAAFSNVINSKEFSNKGKLIRLEKTEDGISLVDFDSEELRIAEKQNIEVR